MALVVSLIFRVVVERKETEAFGDITASTTEATFCVARRPVPVYSLQILDGVVSCPKSIGDPVKSRKTSNKLTLSPTRGNLPVYLILIFMDRQLVFSDIYYLPPSLTS